MKRRLIASAMLAVALVCTRGVRAQAQAQEMTAPGLDPQAVQILRACLNRVKDAKAYTVTATLSMHAELGGQRRAVTAVKFIALERPNRLALLPRGEAGGGTLVCDGKRLYAAVPEITRYVDDGAPATLDELARRMDMRIVAGRFFLLDALVANDPYAFAMADVASARMVGEEDVGGAICRRLRMTQPGLEWDVWVEKGDAPVIRKVSPNITERLNARARAMGRENPMKVSIEVSYDDWDFEPTLSPEWFAFKPPRGGDKTPTFIDLSRLGQSKSPLLGGPAPDFSLPLLEGGKMRLSEHKGKNVVILDFWATYCGPCTDMLPISAKLAREFRDKGVVFYAVNQGDTLDDIRRFIKALGVDCAVALDAEDAATRLYDAGTIPRTVVIGIDGTVQAVHAGFHPVLESVLKQELVTLTSGGRLIEAGEGPSPDNGGPINTP